MPPLVVACSDPSLDSLSLLELTLEKASFWDQLEAARVNSGLSEENFKIIIKPDLNTFETQSAAGTDPVLVEHLIDLLAERGYSRIIVVDSEDDSTGWLENRQVQAIAELVGYHYITKGGFSYDVVSLSDDLIGNAFEPTDLLHSVGLSSNWTDADFRILFTKNKSDEEHYFSLCLNSLISILPLGQNWYQFHYQFKEEELAVELLKRNEVHFCLIDAYRSNHGIQGTRSSCPIETRTIIASANLLLADWVGALKMGLDPYCSSNLSHALKGIGLPEKYKIEGDLKPYEGWKNVPKLLSDSVKKRNGSPLFRQMTRIWLQTVDQSIFPFRNAIDAQINKSLTEVVKDVDAHPLAYSALVALNYLLGQLYESANAYNTLYKKENIYRQHTDLGFDVDHYSDKDFEQIRDYITPLQLIVKDSIPDQNGLKWRYIDGSVLFEFARMLPYDYTFFVEKVEIAKSVQLMFDNIGGTIVGVKKDEEGRIKYQAERDVYLPQPNWLVLFGGKPIDVCKIELLRYSKKSRQIYWRTVSSPNGSAEFDDGMVTFSSSGKGKTSIKIVARQKFALPLIFKVFDIDNVPTLKAALVSDSYVKFFNKTIANFEACCEGRNPRIGRELTPTDSPLSPHHWVKVDEVKNALGAISGLVERLAKPDRPIADDFEFEDEFGYRHYGSGSANEDLNSNSSGVFLRFLQELTIAIQKDINQLSSRQ